MTNDKEITSDELRKTIGEMYCHIPEIGRRIKDTFHPSFIELLTQSILEKYNVVRK